MNPARDCAGLREIDIQSEIISHRDKEIRLELHSFLRQVEDTAGGLFVASAQTAATLDRNPKEFPLSIHGDALSWAISAPEPAK
jgi:hypothetical protein